jgi:NADH:ubiquinone oxidoreductase subunit E
VSSQSSAGPSSKGPSVAVSRVRVRPTLKGRTVDPNARKEVCALLDANGEAAPRRRDLLIEYLHRIQDRYGHLSAARLAALAAELKMAQAEVFEVATFYHHFDVVKEGEAPPPALTVRVCDSLSCEMAGAKELLARLPGMLGKGVRVIPAPCIGRCESAPNAVVGQNPVPQATAENVSRLVAARATRHIPGKYITYREYRKGGGYTLLAQCLAGKRDHRDLIRIMEDSGLRGLGGAGFPAGRKWKIVRAEAAPRNMAVNIDEGEPGTFKDRYFLERDPHRFLEGMLVAAWTAGVGEIWIYLRDEYAGCRAILEKELAAL